MAVLMLSQRRLSEKKEKRMSVPILDLRVHTAFLCQGPKAPQRQQTQAKPSGPPFDSGGH